jgi:hypothetical protein
MHTVAVVKAVVAKAVVATAAVFRGWSKQMELHRHEHQRLEEIVVKKTTNFNVWFNNFFYLQWDGTNVPLHRQFFFSHTGFSSQKTKWKSNANWCCIVH